MGFSGGGSNILKPHTHDGTVAQDGGALNMDNVTQASLTAGDIVYSDGVHLQRLAYPGTPAGEALTAAAASTAPSWVAAGGGAIIELIDSTVLSSSAADITTTISPAIDFDTVSEVIIIFSGSQSGGLNQHYFQLNGVTSGVYNQNGFSVAHGGIFNRSAQTFVQLISNNNSQFFDEIKLTGGNDNSTSNNRQICGIAATRAVGDWTGIGFYMNTGSAQNTLSEVKVISGSGNFEAGSMLTIYKVNNS